MKTFHVYLLIIICLLISACGTSSAERDAQLTQSATFDVDLVEPVSIANDEMIVTVKDVVEIDEIKILGGDILRPINLPDHLRLIEVKMSYKNNTQESTRLDNDIFSLKSFVTDQELVRVAFCYPSLDDPFGPAVDCERAPYESAGQLITIKLGRNIYPGREGGISIIVEVPVDVEKLVLSFK